MDKSNPNTGEHAPGHSGGCKFCNENATCIIVHSKKDPIPTKEEQRVQLAHERELGSQNNAEKAFRQVHRHEAKAYDLPSRYEEPDPRNTEDSPFCCMEPHLEENRRAKGHPPVSIEGNINSFVDAANASRIEYMINDIAGTKEYVDAALDLIKVNPLKRHFGDGTWIYVPSPKDDTYNHYYGVFKTATQGFQMSGPRSYLVFVCRNCLKSYKIGYITKTVNPLSNTKTFEYDPKLDEVMGIPQEQRPRAYRATFSGGPTGDV